ncbi:hypothetical protein CN375_04235 [Bacillus cereus]|uniref:hypothetical protein n=1 Tax=Bacillus cereus TaxID=1396 RepID=UPI000BF72F92|nr:hypothetical protein [Bacillus cereus]PFA00663.1 hypothetical protein CN375_04235 [Bacillus cereus]
MKLTANRFENETYKCLECNEVIESENVNRETWKCNRCKEKIVIGIGEKSGMLIRIRPNEVRQYDSVFDQYDRVFLEVKGDPFDCGEYYYIPVAGHGKVKVVANDFVNCMWRMD